MNKVELEQEQADAKLYDYTVELLEYGYYKTKHALTTLSLKTCTTLKEYNDKFDYYTDLLRRIANELNFYNRQILVMNIKDSSDYYMGNTSEDYTSKKSIEVEKQIDKINKQANIKKY